MIYLDNAATSWPKAPGLAAALAEAVETPMGNPGRSSHEAGISADRILFELRETMAELLKVNDSSTIIFNSGATESLNTVLSGFLKPGMKVLTSSMEHNSVMRPLMHLQDQRNLQLRRFPSDSLSGYPDLKQFSKELQDHPDLVVVTAASNVNGVIFPIEEMAHLTRKAGVPLCVDAAQGGGEIPLYPERWGIDFLCFAGHKGLLGPGGTGGFYIKDYQCIDPLIRGGTGSRSKEEEQPETIPDKFESGTPNIPGLAGLLHSLKFLLHSEEIRTEAELKTLKFIEDLRELDGFRLIGRPSGPGFTRVISLLPTLGTLTELTAYLNSKNIAVRSGLQCAPSAHKTLMTFHSGGTLRLSPGLFTTNEELDETILTLKEYIWQIQKN
ncbi:aminotransferase class V-fold PLP-dependent enzyme [Oceanispirochaeta crateris]|uniref:cysteine desulfurase n=1 Tax=Oceanispirochaeta crateris TaxID=2518645 RepID=A0A5C1QM02_9SPIO|nr:aminotransferase class V-fold PLP-dependent enzyme [Oceanispirochaeta crateris]QEN09135.1 aminotransferase class V-fold PLP-dependent enzyme [Oceanispirochaeta crateris]